MTRSANQFLSILLMSVLCVAAYAQTPIPILDGDLEENPNSAWTRFGNGGPDNMPDPTMPTNANPDVLNDDVFGLTGDPGIGFDSGLTFGIFSGQRNFSGFFQDIPVDGTNVSVGDLIQLDAFGVTPEGDSIVGSQNDAFIELTYVSNGSEGPTGVPAGEVFGFGEARSANLAALPEDEWHNLFTTGTFVPSLAGAIRVTAVFIQPNNEAGAAWFDNFSLNIIPEIDPGLVCDADGDGGCDITDIDALYAQFGGPGSLDLDGSGVVDDLDIQEWLVSASDAANPAKINATDVYQNGDVNLDGSVNSDDLGILLNNFGDGSGLGFGSGNLNDDQLVNSDDLGIQLNNFGFTSAAASAVPEPSSAALILVALFGLITQRRRR